MAAEGEYDAPAFVNSSGRYFFQVLSYYFTHTKKSASYIGSALL